MYELYGYLKEVYVSNQDKIIARNWNNHSSIHVENPGMQKVNDLSREETFWYLLEMIKIKLYGWQKMLISLLLKTNQKYILTFMFS